MNITIPLYIFISLLCIIFYSCSQSKPDCTIKGYVTLPKAIDPAAAPKEAFIYIYLEDYTPKDGKKVMPWDASVMKVVDVAIYSLTSHQVPFAFNKLPEGLYGVSVLIDIGRPHVSKGSTNFIAYPGDYAGGTKENVQLEKGQTKEVMIKDGMYVTIPEGYESPLYLNE